MLHKQTSKIIRQVFFNSLRRCHTGKNSVASDMMLGFLYSNQFMLDTQEFFDSQQSLRQQFGIEHDYRWQVGMNGRSGGYLVLYQGEVRTDGDGKKQVVCYPGRSTDDGEDFEDWTTSEIRRRVRLVQSFDKLADALVQQAVDMTKHYSVEEEEYLVPQVRKVLVPIT